MEQQSKREWGTGSIYRRPHSNVWWIRYSRNGKRFYESTHTTRKRKAKRRLDDRLAEIRAGTFVGPQVHRIKIKELAKDLIDEYQINGRKSLDDLKARWKLHLEPYFAHLRTEDVTSTAINRYVANRQTAGAANGTVNRELAALKRMFKLGSKATPPKVLRVPTFPHLEERNVRTGFLTDDQFSRLAAECARMGLWLRAMLEVGYTFGWRVEEIKSMRVRQVDLAANTIRLDPETTKNRDGREVTMTDPVHTLLAACVHGKEPDDYVFTRDGGARVSDFRDSWAKACARAGLGQRVCQTCSAIVEGGVCDGCKKEKRPAKRIKYEGLIFHDLRRSAARNLRRAGVAEGVIMEIGGWRTRSMFERYAIVSKSDKDDAMRKLEQSRKWDTTGTQASQTASQQDSASYN